MPQICMRMDAHHVPYSTFFFCSMLGIFSLTSASTTKTDNIYCLPLKPCREHSFSENFKQGFVLGYEVSAIFFTVCFLSYYSLLCYLYFKKRKRKTRVKLYPLTKNNQRREAYNRAIKLRDEISEIQKWVDRMNFEEISKATNNFNKHNIIGLGRMGTMYRAPLKNGCAFAVKRLNDSPNQDREFIYELKSLGRLRHKNLVPLLGFCIERTERILVYKYMSNGNLYDWLHHPVEEHEVMIMEWPLRVKIAVGIARGLAWLHHNCNFRRVHLNINSNCILLDENFEPKISNSMDPIHPNSSRVKGVIGGDEIQEMDGCEKEDVYRFGIVLLELITLKEPSLMTLVEWVSQLLSGASAGFYHRIDGSLVGNGFDCEIIRLLRIVAECVQPFPDERPTMLQVYQKLLVVGERYGLT